MELTLICLFAARQNEEFKAKLLQAMDSEGQATIVWHDHLLVFDGEKREVQIRPSQDCHPLTKISPSALRYGSVLRFLEGEDAALDERVHLDSRPFNKEEFFKMSKGAEGRISASGMTPTD